jgi:hypothetical protein
VGHGSTGAAGTELHDATAAHVGQVAAEALGKAPPVGVVADALAVLQDDRVDRPECSSILR